MKTAIVAALGLAVIGAIAALAQTQSGPTWMRTVVVRNAAADASGNIRVPANYRTTYEFLGSWAVAADQGAGAKQQHIVYASPGAVAAYRKSGHFPDGTVLVKEVYATSTGSMTTGTVSHELALQGWFVMVVDSENDHPGNKLWGDGWGWSWFDANNSLKTTSTDYKTDCQSCHVPARSTQWIYVQGYPALHRCHAPRWPAALSHPSGVRTGLALASWRRTCHSQTECDRDPIPWWTRGQMTLLCDGVP